MVGGRDGRAEEEKSWNYIGDFESRGASMILPWSGEKAAKSRRRGEKRALL